MADDLGQQATANKVAKSESLVLGLFQTIGHMSNRRGQPVGVEAEEEATFLYGGQCNSRMWRRC